jgi:hypothetical protein
MTDALARFRLDYAPLMLRYLSQQDEEGLQAAYELGRAALREQLGLLDIVRVHNELLLEVLATARGVVEAHDVARSSTTLLIDLVASYDMSQRAYMGVSRPPGPPARGEAGSTRGG